MAAEFWTTFPSVGAAVGEEEEEEPVKVQSSTFVVSGEEVIVSVVL